MSPSQPLPLLWLLSDARNDAALEGALRELPTGSGFVFRHYHLDEAERRARFAELIRLAHQHRHCFVLSGTAVEARQWDADGVYGPAHRLGQPSELLRLATVHDRAELQTATAAKADGVFLSPVFTTGSHPGAETLGIAGFHALARLSPIPVIALGGMTHARARALDWPRWGAIDGLVSPNPA